MDSLLIIETSFEILLFKISEPLVFFIFFSLLEIPGSSPRMTEEKAGFTVIFGLRLSHHAQDLLFSL